MKTDPDAMRARFWELRAEREKAEADLQPLRTQLDDLVKQVHDLHAKMKPVEEEYKKQRETLVPIDEELSMISRALKNKTALPEHSAKE